MFIPPKHPHFSVIGSSRVVVSLLRPLRDLRVDHLRLIVAFVHKKSVVLAVRHGIIRTRLLRIPEHLRGCLCVKVRSVLEGAGLSPIRPWDRRQTCGLEQVLLRQLLHAAGLIIHAACPSIKMPIRYQPSLAVPTGLITSGRPPVAQVPPGRVQREEIEAERAKQEQRQGRNGRAIKAGALSSRRGREREQRFPKRDRKAFSTTKSKQIGHRPNPQGGATTHHRSA